MSESKEHSFSEMFYEGESKHAALDAGANAAETQDQVKAALLLFLKVKQALASEGMISANEEIDDINTNALKYLLVPFYLGDLLLSINGVEGRLKRIHQAVGYFRTFLDSCEEAQIMTDDDAIRYSTLGSLSAGNARPNRDAKIAAYKRDKMVQDQIKMLLKKKAEMMKRGMTDEEAEEDDTEREYRLAVLDCGVRKAMDHIHFTKQEIPMLEHMAKMKVDPSFAREQEKITQSRVKNAPKPNMWKITDASQLGSIPPEMASLMHHITTPTGPMPQGVVQGSNFQGSSALSASEAARQAAMTHVSGRTVDSIIRSQANSAEEVFRDPNPCTKTLDEWVDEEQAAGRLPTPEDHRPPAGPRRYVHENDDEGYEGDLNEEEEDAKTMKDSEWDDYCDENEKGIGNRDNNW